MLDQASKVMLVLKPVPEVALLLEQLQHILDPYSEERLDAPPVSSPLQNQQQKQNSTQSLVSFWLHDCFLKGLGRTSGLWTNEKVIRSCENGRLHTSTLAFSPAPHGIQNGHWEVQTVKQTLETFTSEILPETC